MRLRPTNLFLTIIIWGVAWNISADAAFDRLSYATQVWCGIGFSSSPSEPATHRFFSTFSKPFTVPTLTEHFISYRFRLGTPFKVEIETDWQQFGTQTYAEDLQTLAVTISKAQFDLQARVDRFQLRIDNFGQRSAFGLAVGAKWQIRPSFTTTLLVSRLNKPQLPSILIPDFQRQLADSSTIQCRVGARSAGPPINGCCRFSSSSEFVVERWWFFVPFTTGIWIRFRQQSPEYRLSSA